jgi:nitroreductase
MMIPAITGRFSPLQFVAEKEISEDQRNAIFEAGRWAASSFNEQPWRFVWAHRSEPELWNRFLSLLTPYNRRWASTAQMLVVAMVADQLKLTGKPNAYAWHDLGMACAQMAIQASSLGIQAHPMGGFDADLAIDLLEIPEGFTPVTAIAFGFPDEISKVHEEFRERAETPRSRNELHEFVFFGKFDPK